MAGSKARSRIPQKPQIPRISAAEASAIFNRCEHILEDSRELLENLRNAGIAELFARLDDLTLQLAIQPDSWGERTRARLISEVFTGLRGIPAEDSSVEEIAEISNIVMPCFLLELGHRRQHIEIEFPANPCDSAARFGLRAGPSYPIHSIDSEQLVRLVAETGEELVGLCYFGDQQSRENIEAQLAFKGAMTESKTRPRASSSSSKTKH